MNKVVPTRNRFAPPDQYRPPVDVATHRVLKGAMQSLSSAPQTASPRPHDGKSDAATDLARHWRSVEDWWTLAGVDTVVGDTPFGWLTAATDRQRACPEALAAPPGPNGQLLSQSTDASLSAPRSAAGAPPSLVADGPLPADLDGFLNWWAGTSAPPLGAPAAARVAPSGQRDAELFILTDMPEDDDRDHGVLLGGALAPMFERMLKALGTDRSRVWTASLIAARPGHGRIAPTDLPRLGEIARHHIALVRPKRLWLMGQSASRALLGIDARDNDRHSLHLNHDAPSLLTVTTAHPRLLATNPQDKKAAWAAMQALIAPFDGDAVQQPLSQGA